MIKARDPNRIDSPRRLEALRTLNPLRVLLLAFGLVAGLAYPFSVVAESTATSEKAPSMVFPNAESVQPLAVGDQIPSAAIRTIDGASVDVATLTRERGALLVFYRGGW